LVSRLLLPPLLLLKDPLRRRLLVRALLKVRHHGLLVAHPRDAVDAVAARRRRRRGERRRGGEGREQAAPRDPLPLDGDEREILEEGLRDEVVREAVSTEW